MFFHSFNKCVQFVRLQSSQTGLRHVTTPTFKWEWFGDRCIQIHGWTCRLYTEQGRTQPIKMFLAEDGLRGGLIKVKRSQLGKFIKRTTV